MMISNTPIRNSVTQGSSYGPALPELHRRLRWVAIVGIAAFALLVGRLWQLQVMRGESYYARTVSNVVKERYLPSVRGQILDRKGTPLATNRPAFNMYAVPKMLTPENASRSARSAMRRARSSSSKIKVVIGRRSSSRREPGCQASRCGTSRIVTIRRASWPPRSSVT
jgi:cell division protein FtsI/penicillin-binding protein 2